MVTSAYTTASTTVVGKTIAPAALTGLVAVGLNKQIGLSWNLPAAADVRHIEIWAAATNDRATATLIARAAGTTHLHSGLGDGVTRFYWIRAVDFAGNIGPFNTGANAGTSAMTITTSSTVAPGSVGLNELNSVVIDRFAAIEAKAADYNCAPLARPTLKGYGEAYQILNNSDANHTLDLSQFNVFVVYLNVSKTITLTGGCAGGKPATIFFVQGSPANRTFTISGVKWRNRSTPSATPIVGAIDMVVLYQIPELGWLGALNENFG
jgi:hypothetical protein